MLSCWARSLLSDVEVDEDVLILHSMTKIPIITMQSSIVSKFIYISLNNELNLIAGNVVNTELSSEEIKIIYSRSIKLKQNNIRLYTVFSSIWDDCLTSLDVLSDDEVRIGLEIGSMAGFTDARVLYMWLKTHSMFNPKTSLKVIKSSENISEIEEFDYNRVRYVFEKGSEELVYSTQPNIGSNH